MHNRYNAHSEYIRINELSNSFCKSNSIFFHEKNKLENNDIKAVKKLESKFSDTKIFKVVDIQNLRNKNRIGEFLSFKKNWNQNGASPYKINHLEKAMKILDALPFAPEVFPTAQESVQLEYEKMDGQYLEFEVFDNRVNVFCIDKNGEEDEFVLETTNLEEILKLVEVFYG